MLKTVFNLTKNVRIMALPAILAIVIFGMLFGINLIDQRQKQNYANNYAVLREAQTVEHYIERQIEALQELAEQLDGNNPTVSSRTIGEHLQTGMAGFSELFLNYDIYQLLYKVPGDTVDNQAWAEAVPLTAAIIKDYNELLRNNVAYEAFSNSRKPVVSSLLLNSEGEETIFIALPLWREGKYCGYLFGTLDMPRFYSILGKNRCYSSSYTVLLDNRHQIIYHPSKNENSSGELILPIFDILQSNLEGTQDYYSPVYNRQETAYFSTIADLGWVVWVAAPQFEVYLPFYRNIVLCLFILFTGLYILLYLRDALHKNILLPLAQLNVASKQLSTGDYSYRVKLAEKNIPQEIMELDTHLKRLAEKLETSDNFLKEHGSKLEKRVIERTNELVMQKKETAVLYAVAFSVSNTHKLNDVLNRIFNQIMTLFEVEFTIVYLHNDNKYLHNVANETYAIWRVNYPQTEKIIYTEATSRFNQLAFGENRIISIGDLEKAEEEVPLALRWSDIRSLVSVPICYQNTVLGAVTITSCAVDRFGKQEISMLQAVCSQLGVVITNLGLFNMINEEHDTILAIINSMNEGLLVLDDQGKILYINPLLFAMFYLDSSEWQEDMRLVDLKAKLDPELIVELPSDELKEHYFAQKVYETGQALITYKNVTKYYFIQGFPVMTGDVFIGYGYVVRDITREKEIDILKSSILSTVSHELRSPLTSIYGSAQSLIRKDVVWTPEEQQEFYEAIVEDSIRLRELIDNIMDMSKIEAGALNIDINPNDLLKTTERIVKSFSHRFPDYHLVLEVLDEIPYVLFDEHRIEQVYNNLLENAVKYSPDAREIKIEISLLPDQHMVKVGVIDRGIGIPPQDQEAIFERFYRVSDIRAKQIKGSGVGLSITRGIIKRHSGEIWVESELGQGSRFYFTLPYEKTEEERR